VALGSKCAGNLRAPGSWCCFLHETREKRDRSPKTYRDCLALAKKRGGPYGIKVGWQLCLEKALPDLPEEIEIETKYASGGEDQASIDALQRKLDEVPYRMGKSNRG